MYENCENCIEGRPRIGRLVGVTRTLRLAVFEGDGVPQGTPQDLTSKTVVVRVLQDGTGGIFVPEFVVEGTGNNVVKFTWPANRQAVGNYTFDITITDGSGNVSRVNWHGRSGIRLVQYSNEQYGADATGVKSNDEIGLIGYFTTSGEGMSAYEEWLASDESEGYERTVDGFFEWMRKPASDAAAAAEAQMNDIQSRADEDHRVAGADHTLADSDHTRAGNDHTRAEGDHTTAADDHRIAAADHETAGDDHTLAAADHVTAVADHETAGDDHTLAASDHGTATDDHRTAGADHETATADHGTAGDDHTQAGLDHTQAVSDHGVAAGDHTRAGEDHTQAGNDHTRAEADHGIAADDHTQAVADHAIVEGYNTRLTNVEGEVSQLGQKAVEKSYANIFNPNDVVSGYLNSNGTITDYASYVTTGYIPVTPGQVFYKATDSDKGFRFSLMYSDNVGTVLAGSYVSSDANTITVPSGAAYMRVTLYATNAKNQISLLNVKYYAYNPVSRYVYDILGDFQSSDISSILSRLTGLESFKNTVPISDIQYITKNVFCIKDYFIDNKYYNVRTGEIADADTYACISKIPVECAYIFNLGFKPSGALFWDADNNYLGSVTPTIGGKNDFPEGAAYFAVHWIKASQPTGYIDSGILYNLEPFVPFSALNSRLNALEAFKDDVPLTDMQILAKCLFPIKDYLIDNSYYSNTTGVIFGNTPTYACTSKIPVDRGYYYTDAFSQTIILCWGENDSFLGTSQGVVESGVRRFNLLPGTTKIAFNMQKSAQPEGYLDNGVIFNMMPFVKDYDIIIQGVKEQNVLYGKKWCVVGDSFSEWSNEQFVDGRFANLYKTYKYFIALRNDMNIVDMTLSGRTMAYPSDHTFDNAFSKPSLYQSIPADADYITIMLGINDVAHLAGYSPDGESTQGAISLGSLDSSDTGTFYGAWNVVLEWIFENRPNAHFGIIITNGLGAQGPNGGYSEYGLQIYNAIKAIVQKWNIPYIDLNGGDGKTPMMQRGVYPEGTPAALIAAKWNAFAAAPTVPYNGHTNVAGHLYESTFIEHFLRTL